MERDAVLLGLVMSRTGAVCAMLERMLADPAVNHLAITRMGLDFTLEAVVSVARTRLQEQPDDELAPALRDFLELSERLALLRRDANLHLAALAADWRCPECGQAVPERMAVVGLRRGPLHVLVVCKACSARTETTPEGRAAFEELYGALVGPRWNPRVNELEWDGS